MKLLKFTNNFLAVLVLALLVGVSAATTMALSPLGVGSEDSRVAGINEGSIISNPSPLKFEDVAVQLPNFRTQLVLLEPTLYSYNIELGELRDQQLSFPVLRVTNPNSTGIKLSLSSRVAGEISPLLHANLSNGIDSYRLHDAELGDVKQVEVSIPAGGTVDLSLILKTLQPINFTGNLSLVISY